MANGQINKLLEFVNMQMAAEAFLARVVDEVPNQPPSGEIRDRLVEGNTHPSRFMPVQAEQFIAQYEVLTQYRNDPLLAGGTGFSATLFKNRETGELTLSFRSTEFIDDAVRDNKTTNELEIKQLGWAFGQIAEMEAWYKNTLRADGGLLQGKTFNVTGYSLGGHLATAFNILRREEAAVTGDANPVLQSYTFNGAGTGAILNGRHLTDIIADFDRIRVDYVASPEWVSLSQPIRDTYLAAAQIRIDAITAERFRVAGLAGVTPAFAMSAPPGDQILLGYQIAALLVARDTVGASNFPLPGGTNYLPSSPVYADSALRFTNMTEIVGMETDGLATSFISNSGVHYGYRQEVAIEGQPTRRGTIPTDFVNQWFNLLVENPGQNDFGDTHSLVLLVDSLSLTAVMETLAPNLTLESAREIFAAMSSAAASSLFLTQGKAEGDTLERLLDAVSAKGSGLAIQHFVCLGGKSCNPTFCNLDAYMARPLRIELAGGLYHVTSRGDRREDIYFNEADRRAWLETFSQVCTRFNWVCHAWCQMTNHYHIVVETAEGNLSLGMRQLNGVYTQTINRTHDRVGHVFQGRYKAILVEKDSYLLELARYVVLNPVRAGMVRNTAAWPWSSYHAMIGSEAVPSWLQIDWVLGQFSPQRGRAIKRYIDFVREGVGLPSLWGQLRGQVFLGGDAFLKQMQKLSDKAAVGEIPRVQRRPLAKPLRHYRDKLADARKGMAAAYATGDYTMQEIADCFDVHYATVSRAVKHSEGNV